MNHRRKHQTLLCLILRIFQSALFLCVIFHSEAQARLGAPVETQKICLNYQLAHLHSGRPGCRASFSVGERQTLCLSDELWTKPTRSGTWEVKKKVFSPPENDDAFPHTKKIETVFYGVKPPGDSKNLLEHWFFRIEKKRRELSIILDQPEDREGFLRHLLLNETHSPDSISWLRTLGWVHVFGATGIHIYALAYFWNLILRFFLLRFGIDVRRGLRIRRVLVGGTWVFSWVLAGAPWGMLRPGVVFGLYSLAKILGFRWKKWTPIFFVIAAHWVESSWLYSLAVVGSRLDPSLFVGAWVFVSVWDAWRTGLISLATPLLSAISIPVICFGIYPIALVSAFFNWNGGLLFSAKLMSFFILKLTEWVLALPSVWVVSRWGLLASAGIALGLLGTNSKKKSMIVVTFLVLGCLVCRWVSLTDASSHEASRVELLDVGQGDSSLVIAQDGQAGLIDAGSVYALSQTQWMILLAQRRITRLSWIALTHLDEDHSGGVFNLVNTISIGCVVTSLQELESPRGLIYRKRLKERGLRVVDWSERCEPYPYFAPPITAVQKNNQNMSALLVPLAGGGFYLSAGDADARDEVRIGSWVVSEVAEKPRLTQGPHLLKISHHGSKTSSAPEFLKQIEPSETWISSGVGNPYGHPAPEILQRIEMDGFPLHRTDHEGSVVWKDLKK